MLARLLAHLRQQWMGALALFLVLASGTAYAANTVFSSDIVNDQVFSADVRNDTLTGGGLTAADLRGGSVGNTEIADGGVRSVEVQNEALTGTDIKDQSGVDTCTHGTVRFGELCVRVANQQLEWPDARQLCAGLELRLPSLGEAESLAQHHDLPNVDPAEPFWTEESTVPNSGNPVDALVYIVTDSGLMGISAGGNNLETVCVTTPTN